MSDSTLTLHQEFDAKVSELSDWVNSVIDRGEKIGPVVQEILGDTNADRFMLLVVATSHNEKFTEVAAAMIRQLIEVGDLVSLLSTTTPSH